MGKEEFPNSWLDKFLIRSKSETLKDVKVLCQALRYWDNTSSVPVLSTVL